jgi:hypothetical protein
MLELGRANNHVRVYFFATSKDSFFYTIWRASTKRRRTLFAKNEAATIWMGNVLVPVTTFIPAGRRNVQPMTLRFYTPTSIFYATYVRKNTTARSGHLQIKYNEF